MPDPSGLAQDLAGAVRAGSGDDASAPGVYRDAVHRLLAIVRTQLGMQVAWVSEFVGLQQVLRFVDAEDGADAPSEGSCLPLNGSFCARVLDGRFPALIPDARVVPEAALLDVTAQLHIGSYVGVPLVGPEGAAAGMLCAISDRPAPGMSDRDVVSLRLLADLLHDLQRRAVTAAESAQEQDRLRFVLNAVIGGKGRHPVLQPVVDLRTGRAVAAEGLTRFTLPSPAQPRDPASPPAVRSAAQWFDDADRLGLRRELELATAASILDLLPDERVPESASLTVNLSPETLLGPGLDALLHGRELPRIVVELTEHAPVPAYDRLAEVLQPYRARGLRIAVDDAGAGYSSLQHVLALHPDLVKVDMALTRGVDADLARRALISSLVRFAATVGCELVAEGVETEAELHALAGCGVTHAQGFLLGEPSTRPRWSGFPAV
jgi:EAL domain-containing protein (putative c-di-GMP-specific phosphodiesterase class I)